MCNHVHTFSWCVYIYTAKCKSHIIYPSINASIHQYMHPSIHPSINPPIHPSFYLSFSLCIHIQRWKPGPGALGQRVGFCPWRASGKVLTTITQGFGQHIWRANRVKNSKNCWNRIQGCNLDDFSLRVQSGWFQPPKKYVCHRNWSEIAKNDQEILPKFRISDISYLIFGRGAAICNLIW